MATFQEIFDAQTTAVNQEPSDKDALITLLKNYYNDFHPFFTIGDSYLRGGLPFFTQNLITLNQFENQMHNKIENKLSCGFEIALKPKVNLKVRFVLQNGVTPAMRVQLVVDGNTRSEEYNNQELAAAVLAKIVLKYKD